MSSRSFWAHRPRECDLCIQLGHFDNYALFFCSGEAAVGRTPPYRPDEGMLYATYSDGSVAFFVRAREVTDHTVACLARAHELAISSLLLEGLPRSKSIDGDALERLKSHAK